MPTKHTTVVKTANSKASTQIAFVAPATGKGSRNYANFQKAMREIQDACKNSDMFTF